MCELYLHLAAAPTDCHPGLTTFFAHADAPWDNPDGWGLAALEGQRLESMRGVESATQSAQAMHLANRPPRTASLIGHLRKSTAGAVCLANTQPFTRELAARPLVFAHNGALPGFADSSEGRRLRREARGTTDSELALLALLRLARGRRLGRMLADMPGLVRRLSGWGPLNLIVSDGEDTVVVSDRRAHASDGPDAPMRPPGLLMRRTATGGIVVSSEPLGKPADGLSRGTWMHLRGPVVVSHRRLALPETVDPI